MAWFWDKKTQTKREIYSITKVGNLPICEVEFKGRGPLGGRKVRTYNLEVFFTFLVIFHSLGKYIVEVIENEKINSFIFMRICFRCF